MTLNGLTCHLPRWLRACLVAALALGLLPATGRCQTASIFHIMIELAKPTPAETECCSTKSCCTQSSCCTQGSCAATCAVPPYQQTSTCVCGDTAACNANACCSKCNALAEHKVSVSFANVRVRDCIRSLMVICSDIDFAIDDAALDAAGVRSVLNKPVINLHASGATVETVLTQILSQVNLTYVVENHRIKITTEEGARAGQAAGVHGGECDEDFLCGGCGQVDGCGPKPDCQCGDGDCGGWAMWRNWYNSHFNDETNHAEMARFFHELVKQRLGSNWTAWRERVGAPRDVAANFACQAAAPRQTEIVQLTNVQAEDVAASLTRFYGDSNEVVVVADPITNQLIITGTPARVESALLLAKKFDVAQAQVRVDAVVAEVDVTALKALGMDLESFQRMIRTASAGMHGKAVPMLIHALQKASFLEVISSPSVTTADNQAARLQVGQCYPYIGSAVVTTNPVLVFDGFTPPPASTQEVATKIEYKDIGVQLQVKPKVGPDGTVVLHVLSEYSSAGKSKTEISEGVFATAFDTQSIDTTVVAHDGRAVVVGGLEKTSNVQHEHRCPWLSDLPWIGDAFRFRGPNQRKTALIVILTPHVQRCEAPTAEKSCPFGGCVFSTGACPSSGCGAAVECCPGQCQETCGAHDCREQIKAKLAQFSECKDHSEVARLVVEALKKRFASTSVSCENGVCGGIKPEGCGPDSPCAAAMEKQTEELHRLCEEHQRTIHELEVLIKQLSGEVSALRRDIQGHRFGVPTSFTPPFTFSMPMRPASVAVPVMCPIPMPSMFELMPR